MGCHASRTLLDPPVACSLEPFARRFRAGREGEAAELVAHGAAAVPHLIAALDDESDDLRGIAALALGELGPVARAALPRMREIAAGPDPFTAAAAPGREHSSAISPRCPPPEVK